MQFTLTITEVDDLKEAAALCAGLHSILTGANIAAPVGVCQATPAEPAANSSADVGVCQATVVAEPATKPKRNRPAKVDPVEAYNALAAEAGVPTVAIEPEPVAVAEPVEVVATPQDDPFAVVSQAEVVEPAEISTDAKREFIITVLRRNAANMAKLGLTKEMGWISSWAVETVDTVYDKAVALA